MTNVTATRTNIRKAAFKNVRTSLLNNITDVDGRVYGSYPLDDVTFPIIVIENGQKSVDDNMKALDGSLSQTVVCNITIYDKQAEVIDTIADEVEDQIYSDINTFKTYGMYVTDEICEDVDTSTFVDTNNQRVHSKTMAVTFEVDN